MCVKFATSLPTMYLMYVFDTSYQDLLGFDLEQCFSQTQRCFSQTLGPALTLQWYACMLFHL